MENIKNYNDFLNEIDNLLNTKNKLEQIEWTRLAEECKELIPKIVPLKDEIKILLKIRSKLKLEDIYSSGFRSEKAIFTTSNSHFFTYKKRGCNDFEILLNGDLFAIYSESTKLGYKISCENPNISTRLDNKALIEIIILVKGFINNYEEIKKLLFDGIEKI